MGHGTGWALQPRPSRSTRASHRRTASPVAELGRGRPLQRLDAICCQPAPKSALDPFLLKTEPPLAFLRSLDEHVLETAELLHVAVPLARILGVDAKEPGLVLLDFLDGERQLGVLGEQEHLARLGIEDSRILAAPVVECLAQLFQGDAQLPRHGATYTGTESQTCGGRRMATEPLLMRAIREFEELIGPDA